MPRREAPQAEPVAVALPADVQAAIEGASVVIRPGDDENGPRIYVQWPGTRVQAWRYSDTTTAEALTKAYPDLNEQQIARAARAVAGLVARKLREPSPYVEPRRNWIMDW